MKALNTIQIGPDEDHEINRLKKELGLPSKKAVVMEGIRTLAELFKDKQRAHRLQALSLRLRKQSRKLNRDWAPLSSGIKIK